MSLKKKTISGLTWSLIEAFSKKSFTFVVGIILARLLTPRDFGLIGMISVFIAVAQSFVQSGLTQALIRKKDCTQTDFSTVFYYNIAVSVFFYLLLVLLAGLISRFLAEPQLEVILKVLGIGLIINAIAIIQRIILTKRIDFKLQANISILSSIGSGIIGIAMAYFGFGVWSLVMKILTGYVINSFLLWLWTEWKPSFTFSNDSFMEVFSFGSKLLLSDLIYTVYLNVYILVIGKFFSVTDLGYYIRADQFNKLTSQSINGIVQRVTYPVLSELQEDIPKLKAAYQSIMKNTMFISFVLSLGMAVIAEPLVLVLIGEKWLPSVGYLQLLCFVGMIHPLHSMNLTVLTVFGKSGLFLRLTIVRIITAVPVILIGIVYGIKIMIVGLIVHSFCVFFLNSYWPGKLIEYSPFQQLKDILPSFAIACIVSGAVFLIGLLLDTNSMIGLAFQILIDVLFIIFIGEVLRFNEYLKMKTIIIERINTLNLVRR